MMQRPSSQITNPADNALRIFGAVERECKGFSYDTLCGMDKSMLRILLSSLRDAGRIEDGDDLSEEELGRCFCPITDRLMRCPMKVKGATCEYEAIAKSIPGEGFKLDVEVARLLDRFYRCFGIAKSVGSESICRKRSRGDDDIEGSERMSWGSDGFSAEQSALGSSASVSAAHRSLPVSFSSHVVMSLAEWSSYCRSLASVSDHDSYTSLSSSDSSRRDNFSESDDFSFRSECEHYVNASGF